MPNLPIVTLRSDVHTSIGLLDRNSVERLVDVVIPQVIGALTSPGSTAGTSRKVE